MPEVLSDVGKLRGESLCEPVGRALLSTARGGRLSRIVDTLADGAEVPASRAHMHSVAAEHGRIDLHGMDLAHRARALISLAAPRFRDELTAAPLNRGLF
jgi:4-hydroxybutyrate CoA-transferase